MNRPNFLSVVIPALNEEERLGKTLESIWRQKCPCPFQVVVSDNGSTDETVKIAKTKGDIVALGSKKGNIASARNVGCRQAIRLVKGRKPRDHLLVMTDADTILCPGYFQAVKKAFQDKQVMTTTGPSEAIVNGKTIVGGRLFQKLHLLLVAKDMGTAKWIPEILRYYFFYGYNTVVRQEVFESLGGLDERFNITDDLYWTLAINKRYGPGGIRYVPGQRVLASVREFTDKSGRFSLCKSLQYMYGKTRREEFSRNRQILLELLASNHQSDN